MKCEFGKAGLVAGALLGAAALAAAEAPDWLNGEPEFLPVDEAFALSAQTDDDGALLARWTLAPGYYLYRHRFAFQVREGQNAVLGEPDIVPGQPKIDDYFGEVEVHYQHAQARVPVRSAGGPVEVGIGYQGCADAGLCYPPQTRWVVLEAAASPAPALIGPAGPGALAEAAQGKTPAQ